MAQDDDGGFLGTTYISHGDDHSSSGDNTETPGPVEASPDADTVPFSPTHDKHDIDELLHHIEALEAQLQSYEEDTEEHLARLDRLSGHSISPEERAYRIQEDS